MQQHLGIYYQLVEKAIKALGIDPVNTRNKEGEWVIYRNGFPLWIYLYYHESSKGYYYQVSAPIMRLPTENQGAFCAQLLSLNAGLIGAAFIERNGTVYISMVRNTDGMDIKETYGTLERIGDYMQYYQESMKTGLLNWTPYNPKGPKSVQPDLDSFSNN